MTTASAGGDDGVRGPAAPSRVPGARCAACGGTRLEQFWCQERVPVNSCLLLDSADEALTFPTGRLDLRFCRDCGFIGNVAFDAAAAEYSARYEETQGYSPTFRRYAERLALHWIDAYGLRGRDVVEIGCGKGEFLALLCELGGNRGVGIDPTTDPGRLVTSADVTLLPELYDERFAPLPVDALVCRHTLEHIGPVAAFLRQVRSVLGANDGAAVLFELPDVRRILDEVAFWDTYYEHCSYFSAGSLARLFRRCGFEVLDVHREYDDQYLILEARCAPDGPGGRSAADAPAAFEDDLRDLAAGVELFRREAVARSDAWRAMVDNAAAAGQRPVVWGGGSKGVAFLSTVGGSGVEYVVDINPHKQGRYMAGTGQQVVAPDFLAGYRPGVVLVMNPVYVDEIGRQLARLGVCADVVGVGSDGPPAHVAHWQRWPHAS